MNRALQDETKSKRSIDSWKPIYINGKEPLPSEVSNWMKPAMRYLNIVLNNKLITDEMKDLDHKERMKLLLPPVRSNISNLDFNGYSTDKHDIIHNRNSSSRDGFLSNQNFDIKDRLRRDIQFSPDTRFTSLEEIVNFEFRYSIASSFTKNLLHNLIKSIIFYKENDDDHDEDDEDNNSINDEDYEPDDNDIDDDIQNDDLIIIDKDKEALNISTVFNITESENKFKDKNDAIKDLIFQFKGVLYGTEQETIKKMYKKLLPKLNKKYINTNEILQLANLLGISCVKADGPKIVINPTLTLIEPKFG
jgi:hypothetical protein